MKWTPYETLLPLRYNDGRPIERKKFRQTHLDLLAEFSGTTADMITAVGAWKYPARSFDCESAGNVRFTDSHFSHRPCNLSPVTYILV